VVVDFYLLWYCLAVGRFGIVTVSRHHCCCVHCRFHFLPLSPIEVVGAQCTPPRTATIVLILCCREVCWSGRQVCSLDSFRYRSHSNCYRSVSYWLDHVAACLSDLEWCSSLSLVHRSCSTHSWLYRQHDLWMYVHIDTEILQYQTVSQVGEDRIWCDRFYTSKLVSASSLSSTMPCCSVDKQIALFPLLLCVHCDVLDFLWLAGTSLYLQPFLRNQCSKQAQQYLFLWWLLF
jgi:hypothetical protein